MRGNVDCHSHIIPCVDDGSSGMDESYEMLKIAEHAGTEVIIATPHYHRMRDFRTGYEEIKKRFLQLKAMAANKNINVDIRCGQEVAYDNQIVQLYDEGEIGTIEGTSYMLIELPMYDFSVREVINNIYELQLKGIKPILAHPERYERFMDDPRLINEFIREDYLFQINIGSLEGDYGRRERKLAECFVNHGIYSFFGSDAHSSEGRTTNVVNALSILEKKECGYLKRMNNNGKMMLENKSLSFDGEMVIKKSIFSFLGK